jgi:HEAT repeat protein
VVAFLHDELGLEAGREAQAAALALGAVVGASEAKTTEVEAGHESLRRRLDAADEPEQQALYLRALGNAGDAEDLPVVADYAGSSEVEVRMAAAKAMRKLRDANSEALLYELFGDTSERVQSAALLALAERPLSESRLEDLRRLVVAGRVADTNLDALVNLLVREQARHPLTREIFTQILANDPRRPELAARLRVLLEEYY